MKKFSAFLDEAGRCWPGYKPVPGKKPYTLGSCRKEEVEQIDELKKSTLASYVNKAANQVRAKSGIAASFETQGARKRNPENKSAYMDVAKDFRQGAKKRLTGIEKATAHKPDVIICDIMMPVLDGYGVLHMLNKNEELRNIPFVFLTAKTERLDFRKGMEMGADDYITKPFDLEVLLLKIKAILKRNEEQHKENDSKEFDLASYHFNPRLRQLSVGDKTHTLSPKENDLLRLLSEHLNDLLPREKALKKIWGSDTYFNGRSMDVYIAKLRKYLKDDTRIEIVNIHGEGFRLVVKP